MMASEPEVPCYFVCPISLQVMRDPVTLPTGITYDRDGIERWLLTAGTCPLTKQPVAPDCEPTPNQTLRRLIQAWCAQHLLETTINHKEEREKPPADRARVAALISQIGDYYDAPSAATRSQDQLLAAGLRELRDMAAESELNRKLIAAVPGAVDTLVAVFASAEDEVALEIVSSLRLSERCLVRAVETNDEALVDAVVSVLRRSSMMNRKHAAKFLADVTAAMPPNRLASLFTEQVFREVVQLLRDRCSGKAATKAALHVLMGATSWGRNRVKAVDAGAVAVLVDKLLLEDSPRVCELALGALDRLCGCAEGRAELVAHGAGVAVLGSKALRVSEATTDKAVRVLRSVAKHAATAAVVQEMAQSGAVGALCLVAQSGQYTERTRERAREALRLHAGAWRTSPCLHHHLQAVYPTTL